ncbi:uncharacterized protein B0H64DRAFT_427698 [Chaetomium fimeti]|uniref:non-specific serine/threonine protein kinase n=1 Tax=Chaetomium fimeti TaxID=1854472 RepID=A0AAE0H661_9PEZI|nr:hypothetical protein B0H64DRAFT_427698 [Chaetomium fimeti]
MSTTGVDDIAAEFAASCQRSKDYPLTVLRTEVFGHTQKSYQARLNQGAVFHKSHRSLYVRDLQYAAAAFDRGRLLEKVDDVEALLDPEEKDPWWRFIFLHSKTSRDPLGCSKEQLTMLLTYHQVMPSFLDLVFTFRSRSRPLNHAVFRHENYLDENLPSLRLPHLGRSGIQIQHAFNLLTVEKSNMADEKNQWPLRHASMYHSLDLETGRAVYILLKGNSELAKRIKDATDVNRHLRPDAPRTPERSFVASLQVHLIMLEWCVEYWTEYIDGVEDSLRTRSVEAKVAPVEGVASPVRLAESFQRRGSTFSRRGTIRTLSRLSSTSHGNGQDSLIEDVPSEPSTPRSPSTPIRAASRTLTGLFRRATGGLDNGSGSVQEKTPVPERDVLMDKLTELEERFSFNELQRLSLIGDEIDRSLLALEQNQDVVSQVQEQYQTVISSHAFTTLLNEGQCKAELAVFFRRVRTVLRDLAVHRRRLLDLSRTVDNDKNMFEALSQHTSIQTSKAFQVVAQTSSDEMMKWTHKMHEIAVKTKQETLSMHVITIFTLIFLPGTFIATFFSSGVLHWDEDGTLGSEWVVRDAGIRLFLSICLPLTVITITIWAVMYAFARRWARRHAKTLGLSDPEYGNEKGLPMPRQATSKWGSWRLTHRPPSNPVPPMPAMALGVNLEPFSRFAEFVAETKPKHTGCDIAGNLRQYVPYTELQTYWTYLRIFSTLVYTHHDTLHLLPRLFISRTLSDERLPLRCRPSEWPDETFHRDFFSRVVENQWQFFPLYFDHDQLHDRLIEDKRILPIKFGEQIAHGSAATIYPFDIHPEYNRIGLDKHKRLVSQTFVFKIYHNKKYEDYYENERRALQRLSAAPSPNLIKFHGSLRQLGSYCLLLEYADGGNLGDFFDGYSPPSTVEDVALFWRSLFQVFSGLERIHQLMSYNEDELIRGIHEDIRPENILLMKGPSGSPYDFTPKVADFGLYSRVRTAKARSGGPMGLDHYGNQRFRTNMITTKADIFSMGAVLSHAAAWVVGGPKEQLAYFRLRSDYHATNLPRFKHSGYEGCFHNSIGPIPAVTQEHKKLREGLPSWDDVTPTVLDWVTACMLVQFPKDRLPARDIAEIFEQFMDNRFLLTPSPQPLSGGTDSTMQSSLWSELGSPTSTLDGVSPSLNGAVPGVGLGLVCRPSLKVLVSSHDHNTTMATVASSSPPTPPPDDPEPTARGAPHADLDRPSHDANSLPSSSSQARQADVSQRASSSVSARSWTPPNPKIGISRIHQYRSAMHDGKPADQETAELVDYLEHNLGGRDQFFFIDDSLSMAADKATVSDGFRALACIAKRLDPNRVELAFASRPRKVFRARAVRRLHDLVTACRYRGDGHLMEDRLGELIDNVIIPRLPYKILGVNVNLWARKKVSVYVFTDGDWGDVGHSADACGVERPVRRLIEELKKRRLDRTQVSLHFVRFGNKENGKRHLQRLDDCGVADGWDIVDVKNIKTDVAGMIIGPLTRSNDDIPTSPTV